MKYFIHAKKLIRADFLTAELDEFVENNLHTITYRWVGGETVIVELERPSGMDDISFSHLGRGALRYVERCVGVE
jgi:hypothetical protein